MSKYSDLNIIYINSEKPSFNGKRESMEEKLTNSGFTKNYQCQHKTARNCNMVPVDIKKLQIAIDTKITMFTKG